VGETYEAAGVSLGAADEVIERIKPHVRSTFGPGVLSDVGVFGSLVAVPVGYQEPVLVSSTDGVGTKLKVAESTGRFDTIGIDLVAMCVDDIAVQGGDPLFFLDYVGVGRLDPGVVEDIVAGVAAGCRLARCALVGGEVAEHGEGHSMDLAGFAVGVVERSAVITGERIVPGDVLVGLASPGLRSNGYSLARKVLVGRPEQLADPAWDGADVSLADELLRPSVVYSPAMAELRAEVAGSVHGFAHVTGGGIAANLARVMPPVCDAVVRWGSWSVPRIFAEVQRRGEVADEEMARVFNLGVGMIAVLSPEAVDAALDVLGDAHVIGEVVPGFGRVVLDRA
jgi:phosphoribosylformylglycinamidine cyclo-ligase